MNTDFDFKNIGKRTPYKVPDDFFDQITEKTLMEAKRRDLRSRKIRRLWFSVASVASVAALIVFGLFADIDNTGKGGVVPLDTLSNLTSLNDTSYENGDSLLSPGLNSPSGTRSNRSEIDKVISNMSDEEIKLLADISYNDLFFEQPQQ